MIPTITRAAGEADQRSPLGLARISPFDYRSLGETWLNLVHATMEMGTRLDGEGTELLGVTVGFPAESEPDALIRTYGNPQMVADMQRVFFENGPNALGHSYAALMRGPLGRSDLQDVISLLRDNPWTKRAVVTLCGSADVKVPCVNAVSFLVRDSGVHALYFSRGQDAFRKFYADGLCLASMVKKVALGLGVSSGRVLGFIASSHVYDRDMAAICDLLARARPHLHPAPVEGGE
jgi:hypothetical protein